MMRLLLTVCVVFSLARADGQESPSSATPRTYEEAVALLPQSERHHFLEVNPAWRKRAIIDLPSGQHIQKSSDRHKKRPVRIFYYKRGLRTAWYPYIKTLYFYPDGKILSEIDDIPMENNPISDDCSHGHFFLTVPSGVILTSDKTALSGLQAWKLILKRKGKTIFPVARDH